MTAGRGTTSAAAPGPLTPRAGQGVHPASWLLLAVTWALFLVPLGLFTALAEDVAEHEVFPFDEPVMRWLHAHGSPARDSVMEVLTQLGGPVAVPVAAILVAAVIWCLGRHRDAGVFAAAVVGSALLNVALKGIFKRTRPDFWQHLVVENSYSFPSGHAMASAGIAAVCVALAWRTRWRYAVLVLALLYVPAVGVSRMYLGVHFPSDVLAGWCAAVAWVGVVVYVFRRGHRRLR